MKPLKPEIVWICNSCEGRTWGPDQEPNEIFGFMPRKLDCCDEPKPDSHISLSSLRAFLESEKFEEQGAGKIVVDYKILTEWLSKGTDE